MMLIYKVMYNVFGLMLDVRLKKGIVDQIAIFSYMSLTLYNIHILVLSPNQI